MGPGRSASDRNRMILCSQYPCFDLARTLGQQMGIGLADGSRISCPIVDQRCMRRCCCCSVLPPALSLSQSDGGREGREAACNITQQQQQSLFISCLWSALSASFNAMSAEDSEIRERGVNPCTPFCCLHDRCSLLLCSRLLCGPHPPGPTPRAAPAAPGTAAPAAVHAPGRSLAVHPYQSHLRTACRRCE
jgi:hypothetical protein